MAHLYRYGQEEAAASFDQSSSTSALTKRASAKPPDGLEIRPTRAVLSAVVRLEPPTEPPAPERPTTMIWHQPSRTQPSRYFRWMNSSALGHPAAFRDLGSHWSFSPTRYETLPSRLCSISLPE